MPSIVKLDVVLYCKCDVRKDGCESLKSTERIGRPSTSEADNNIELMVRVDVNDKLFNNY